MGAMDLVPADNVGETSPSFDIRVLGPVVHAAQMQYQRQIRTLATIHRQFELMADSNGAWRERERRREEKYSQINQEKQTQRENLAEYSARMAERRAERLEAAYRHEEALRAAALAKVQAVEDRLVRFAEERADHAAMERERIAALEAKREATYRQNLELLEGRRQAILAHERKVEDMLRQREELRQLQAQIKAEEDFLRDQQRRAIKARAEGDLAERVAHFHAKQATKEEQASRRIREIEDQRRMRAEELRQRFEYIAAQAHEAAMFAEAERQVLAGKLEDKAARADMLAAHRAALLAEMLNLRHQMQRQEEYLRSSLLRMQQLGTVVIPPEVVRSLESVQLAGPLMAEAVLGGGGGGRAPPQLLLEDGGEYSEGRHGAAAASPAWEVGSRPGAGEALPSPLSARAQMARVRRPKSAGPTPRGIRGVSRGAGGSYSAGGGRGTYNHSYSAGGGGSGGSGGRGRGSYSAMNSPRMTSFGSGGGGGGTAAAPTSAPVPSGGSGGGGGAIALVKARHHSLSDTRPASAGPVLSTQMSASAVASPVTPTSSGPVPYAPYTVPGARGRTTASFRRPTLEEEVAALEDTSERAVEAMTSGRYSGVHEVSRPGSRREEELRLVLQEEIAKESERQILLTQVSDDNERSRLVKYFSHEREEARRRILALSSAAQAALYN